MAVSNVQTNKHRINHTTTSRYYVTDMYQALMSAVVFINTRYERPHTLQINVLVPTGCRYQAQAASRLLPSSKIFFNIFSSQKIQNCQVFLFDRHENIFCLMIKNRFTNNFNLFLLKKYTNNVLLRMRSTVCSLPILASHLRIIFKQVLRS